MFLIGEVDKNPMTERTPISEDTAEAEAIVFTRASAREGGQIVFAFYASERDLFPAGSKW